MGADFSGLSAAGGRSTIEASIKSITRELDGEKSKEGASSKQVSGANGESTDVKSGGGKDESKISDLNNRLQALMSQRESMIQKETKDAKATNGNEKDKDKAVGNAQQQQPKTEVASNNTNSGTSGQQSEQPKKVESGSAAS